MKLYKINKNNSYRTFYKKNKKRKKKINKKNKFILRRILIIIIIFIIVLLISVFICNIKNLFIPNERSKEEINYIINSYKIISREETLKKARNFLDKCLEGLIINPKKFKKVRYPKVSVIIPIYNKGKMIKKVVRSIQNQKMTDIEIVLVNDFSNDTTSQVVSEIEREDPRIKIINNEKNMGILYSRSIGVLYSKGDYIASLDHDDFYTDDDVLETIYYNAIVGNFDIISFDFISITDYHADIYHMKVRHLLPDNFTAYQPGLTPLSSFINNQRFNVDVSIWNKLIRANNYKNSINLLGKEKYSKFCAIYEDNIIMYAISSISNSFKYIHKKGVFNYDNPRTASKKISTRKIVNMMIFFAEVIYDISKIEFKRYAVYQLLFISRGVISKYNEEYFKFVLKKFINSETLKEKYKQRLRDKFSKYLE